MKFRDVIIISSPIIPNIPIFIFQNFRVILHDHWHCKSVTFANTGKYVKEQLLSSQEMKTEQEISSYFNLKRVFSETQFFSDFFKFLSINDDVTRKLMTSSNIFYIILFIWWCSSYIQIFKSIGLMVQILGPPPILLTYIK